MATTWTKNAKETFVEGTKNPSETPGHKQNHTPNHKSSETPSHNPVDESKSKNNVADFGNDVYIGKDTNELILMKNLKDLPNTSSPTVTPASTNNPSLTDQMN